MLRTGAPITADRHAARQTEFANRHRNLAHFDRPGLFHLADCALSGAHEQPWDVVVSEGIKGIVVGRFLFKVLTADADRHASQPPKLIEVANSRHAASGKHREAIREHLTEHGVLDGTALIATDTVSTGGSLRTLGKAVADSGMQPNFAVLATRWEEQELRGMINAPKESKVYTYQNDHDPAIVNGIFACNLGLYTELGNAVPQESKYLAQYPNPGRDATYALYGEMAQEYIDALPA